MKSVQENFVLGQMDKKDDKLKNRRNRRNNRCVSWFAVTKEGSLNIDGNLPLYYQREFSLRCEKIWLIHRNNI